MTINMLKRFMWGCRLVREKKYDRKGNRCWSIEMKQHGFHLTLIWENDILDRQVPLEFQQ